jgi:hypothetical protein
VVERLLWAEHKAIVGLVQCMVIVRLVQRMEGKEDISRTNLLAALARWMQ